MVPNATKAVVDSSGIEVAENETSSGLEEGAGHMAGFKSTLRSIRSQSVMLP